MNPLLTKILHRKQYSTGSYLTTKSIIRNNKKTIERMTRETEYLESLIRKDEEYMKEWEEKFNKLCT